ncbi:MAG: phosphoketolase family protein [Lactobacillus sp.]|jgi:xylulose-5-phosphate/fructose-6-phosphate phosphoketolase|nr:phosphoketolase family protein [Lactobacillus sp.]
MSEFNNKVYYKTMAHFTSAANYLTVAMMYLKDNPLLTRPLAASDVKAAVSGHFGTVPAQNLIFTQVNRLIQKYHQQTLVLQGPGHGGAALLANAYLNNDLVKIDPKLDQSPAGLRRLCQRFAAPFGFASHPEPAIPGAIHPGGELGYVLVHGFGAVLGHKKLLTVCIVGDGEAETGPLQASWQLNHNLTPKDGKVLPVVTINGLTMENTSRLAQMTDSELTNYFQSLDYEPLIVTSSVADVALQKQLAHAFDQAMAYFDVDKWPVILLKTPKGLTGPTSTVGTVASHQLPVDPSDVHGLNKWLASYHPHKLFNDQAQPQGFADFLPGDNFHVTDNDYTNRKGLALKTRDALKQTALAVTTPGTEQASNTEALNTYFSKISAQNPKPDQLRLFSPDEINSNGFENSAHVMGNILSEHMDEGLLEGFLMTGGSGAFISYEGFLPIASSMIAQHLKWLTQAQRYAWHKDINALNLIGTSTVWEQDKNGYTHQNPDLLNSLAAKNPELVRLYLPVDVNTTLTTMDLMVRLHQKVNYLITPKRPTPQWFDLPSSQTLLTKGLSVVDWASDATDNPDVVLAASGSEPFEEVLAASQILREAMPDITIRVILVVDLLRLQHPRLNPRGITDTLFDKLFPKDSPFIYNFHGYPLTLGGLLAHRHHYPEFVNGYREVGSVTTPFDLRVQNGIDRFNVVKEALLCLADKGHGNPALFHQMDQMLQKHHQQIVHQGIDLPEITDWQFKPLQSAEK